MTDGYEDILKQFKNPNILSREGGQKVVYTIDLPNKEQAVLKVGQYDSREDLARIEREVNILRTINSEYFPKNIDFQVVDESRFLIIEEYLPGQTLKQCINQFFDEKKAVDLLINLVKGLSILWKENIVHRDLKPSNIIVTATGPKIIDLGIARQLGSESITKTWAPTGPGTANYASPEQIENRKRDITIKSDQFNLGIIFAQMILAGVHPFEPDLVQNNKSIVENILSCNWGKTVVQQGASKETVTVITKLLGREPHQRYRKPEELLADLEKLEGQLS